MLRFTRSLTLATLLIAMPSVAFADHARRSARTAAAPHRSHPVLATLQRIDAQLRTTRYVHTTRVDERTGRFDFDCSGMVTWVVARSAPRAYKAVMERNGRGRPVASDYYDVITAAPTEHARSGWQRLSHADELRPGDVIAWRRPPSIASHNTGHVLIAVEAPRRIDRAGRRYLVRVADSTSIPHGDDTRPRTHRSGFGYGTIMLYQDDPHGDVVGYGWYGLPDRVDFRTPIALGRAIR